MHDHHHHHHAHGSQDNMAVAFFLNLGFAIIEFIGGLLTNSTAIMADAVHDLGDAMSIGFGWLMGNVSGRPANSNFTYGFRRLSLLSAMINGLVLIAGTSWVLYQSIPRLWDPQMPHTAGMLGLAILGIAVNGYAAWRMQGGKTLNEKVLNWHLLEDMLGWVAVLIVSLVMMVVELPILDPLLAICFSLFILFNVLRHTASSLGLFLQRSPDVKMQQEVEQALLSLPQITGFHHLHFWSLDGEKHVLTVHLVSAQMLSATQYQALKQAVNDQLKPFELAHTTIEIEHPEETCRDQEPTPHDHHGHCEHSH
ncbi:cation diffusion facilitator family transporter [Bowmanella denitrificans]|uniref:cation diffusion facilitator family transporter n=1 Tax=Bowmanella denitrificans TaxID=366582 RepID=UPI000C9CA004|nr:cation diffusion facilitator family transporter [Bowmanella denitrificans]